jgi:hypothetical protein
MNRLSPKFELIDPQSHGLYLRYIQGIFCKLATKRRHLVEDSSMRPTPYAPSYTEELGGASEPQVFWDDPSPSFAVIFASICC